MTTTAAKKEESLLRTLDYKKAKTCFRAIDHKLRAKIITYLIEAETQQTTVTELYGHFRVEQSVMSQHLAILRRAGLVNPNRDGKFIYYSINLEMIEVLNETSKTILSSLSSFSGK